MIDCILTVDYEIYGNGTGSLKGLVLEPMRRLQEICKKWNARLVVFVEVAELEKIEAFGSDPEIELVKQQIRELHRDGCEIGLHIHPQWCAARYEQGRWVLDDTEYNLCTLPPARISQIIDRSLEYLRHIMNQPRFTPLSFRAGNWLFQPTEHAAAALAHRGIKIDSSVFKGGLQNNNRLDYRDARGNGYYWPFGNDVVTPDPAGPLFEVPIFTEMAPFWRMVTSKRLGFTNGSGLSSKSFSQKLNRVRDLFRFWYPLKLDFCRMTLNEMTSMISRTIREDQEDPTVYRPLVAIGHTKDFADPKSVEDFFAFLDAKKISVTTFETAYSTRFQAERLVAMAPASVESKPNGFAYALITPARNEEAFIEQTIQCVVSQTLRPAKWVIVSDGSTDRTDEIVQKYALQHSWIELVRMPERKERHFAGKVQAFKAGSARLSGVDYDVIGNLDADVTFERDYFQFLLKKFEENPRLGVGGTPFSEESRQYDYRFTSIEHVSGACQLFRRECFEEIGGYVPIKTGGVDLVAVITARMKGWRTRSFPEKTCIHHRKMGMANRNALASTFHGGYTDYTHGCDPVWELFRCVYQLTRPPIFLSGSLCLVGYLWALATRSKRVVPADMIQFRKTEQRHRLREFAKGRLHLSGITFKGFGTSQSAQTADKGPSDSDNGE